MPTGRCGGWSPRRPAPAGIPSGWPMRARRPSIRRDRPQDTRPTTAPARTRRRHLASQRRPRPLFFLTRRRPLDVDRPRDPSARVLDMPQDHRISRTPTEPADHRHAVVIGELQHPEWNRPDAIAPLEYLEKRRPPRLTRIARVLPQRFESRQATAPVHRDRHEPAHRAEIARHHAYTGIRASNRPAARSSV